MSDISILNSHKLVLGYTSLETTSQVATTKLNTELDNYMSPKSTNTKEPGFRKKGKNYF